MSTCTYDFDSEDHDAWFLVLITYYFEPGEMQWDERGSYWCPGMIDVESVQVVEFERYDDNGEVVEEWKRTERTTVVTDRERELNALAFDKVVEEVNEWGYLAELMAKAA
jgi:hypothetical protein